MWTSTVPDTHKFPIDARIRIAPHPMHGNGRICEHSPHMCGSAHITDAKDVQIAFANVGMTRARGFGRQTSETGFGFVAGVKVKIIYLYICTHFATSSHIHILLGVLSLSPQHFVINPARHKLRFECLK